MSPLFDELEKQARMLTPYGKVTLLRIVIKELNPFADSQLEQLRITESQRRQGVYLRGEESYKSTQPWIVDSSSRQSQVRKGGKAFWRPRYNKQSYSRWIGQFNPSKSAGVELEAQC